MNYYQESVVILTLYFVKDGGHLIIILCELK